MIDRGSYAEHKVLTSEAIQKVWIEATKRRKRNWTAMPYLLIKPKETCNEEKTVCTQNVEQDAGSDAKNACNTEQSKVKQIQAETEEGSSDEHSLLHVPEYAYNKQTHNYDGLIFTLRQMKITKNEEVNAILRLSDYGRLKGYVWQVIHNTRWSEIVAKGKYLIAALVKEKKKTEV